MHDVGTPYKSPEHTWKTPPWTPVEKPPLSQHQSKSNCVVNGIAKDAQRNLSGKIKKKLKEGKKRTWDVNPKPSKTGNRKPKTENRKPKTGNPIYYCVLLYIILYDWILLLQGGVCQPGVFY